MTDAKQVMAMADYAVDRTKGKLDAAIDREESRNDLIAARALEIETNRIQAMAAIDVIGGLHSAIAEAAGEKIRLALLAKDEKLVFTYVEVLVRSFIRADSEVMATDWMDRIDCLAELFGTDDH